MPQVQNCKDCKTVLTLEQQELPSAGIRTDGTIFGATFTNIQLGRWQMTFNQPNSHGSGWLYTTSASENIVDRDNPKVIIEEGSETANGCIIMVTVDDNGTAADPFANNDISVIIFDTKQIVTSAVTECDGQVVTNECFCQDELNELQDQINNNSTAIANFTDTNDIDYVSDIVISGNNLIFTGVGNGFSGTLVLPLPPTVNPANNTPVPDNLGNNPRSASIGTSLLYARQDHKHQILRQTIPADPALLYGLTNGSTAPQTIVLDRWSDEETVTYAYRVRMDIQAGNGWNYIIVPNLVGFQRPQITIEGTYRNTGNPQRDDGALNTNDGAMPTAPYMGLSLIHI